MNFNFKRTNYTGNMIHGRVIVLMKRKSCINPAVPTYVVGRVHARELFSLKARGLKPFKIAGDE